MIPAAVLTLLGLEGLPEIAAGDDLARLAAAGLTRAGVRLQGGDVVVFCHKVVSKAEGRLVPLDQMKPQQITRTWALANRRDPREVQTVLAEARRVVRAEGALLITETRHGFVCANSGVDRSNTPPGTLCLLPENPDRSARGLAERLTATAGAGVGVVITDTWGRPFRLGAVNVAIGIAGVPALLDYRGRTDPAGRTLSSSTVAFADEVAAAAGLLMGKLRRIPAVLVRGLPTDLSVAPGTGAALLRDRGEDIFR